MTLSHFRIPARLAVCFCALLLVPMACDISQEEKINSTISFNRIFDDLALYDSVVIALKDRQGRTLDIVFKGKVEEPSDVENLAAPHWDGGKAIVSISGYDAAGEEVYKTEADFDGRTNKKDSVKIFRTPGSLLSIPDRSLPMAEGDSLPLPAVTVEPANLADKTLLWSSSNAEVAAIRGAFIKAVGPGAAEITARLQSDPSVTVKVHVTVEPLVKDPDRLVDSVRIAPKTLRLFVGGDQADLTGKVHPASAPQAIRWVSGSEAHATVDANGRITPVSPGHLRIYAHSQADSSVKDSANVTIKVDAPVVRIGEDTVVSLGRTVTFHPVVEAQEFGQITEFKWDLNGDSAWDGSAAAIRPVSYQYDQEKTYRVRFRVKDTEGNGTEVSKTVRAVKGAIVLIQSPLNNSHSRTAAIAVKWTVDGVEQDSLLSQTLKDGPNTITRTVKDAAGTPFSHSITVTLDSVPPAAPNVTVAAPLTRDPKPAWSWTSSGSGRFEYRLASGFSPTGPGIAIDDSLFAPAADLADGTWFFQVREVDAAGNWSAWASASITVDLRKPLIGLDNHKSIPSQIFNVIQPFVGTAADERELRYVQYKVGSGPLITASGSGNWSFTPGLSNGTQVIAIYAEDVAGNKDSIKVPVTYLPKVIFVRKGAGAGSGSSWENAHPELGPVLASDKSYDSGTQIWVSEGTYASSSPGGFILKSGCSVLGGFSISGTNRDPADRNLSQQASILKKHPDGSTVVSNGYQIESSGNYIYGENVSLSDFDFVDGRNPIFMAYANKIVLKNINIVGADCSSCISILGANVDILDSHLNLNSSSDGTIYASNSKVRMRNTEVKSNSGTDGGGITLIGSGFCASELSSIYGNTPSEVQNNGGTFSYEKGVTIGPNGVANGTADEVGKCPEPF